MVRVRFHTASVDCGHFRRKRKVTGPELSHQAAVLRSGWQTKCPKDAYAFSAASFCCIADGEIGELRVLSRAPNSNPKRQPISVSAPTYRLSAVSFFLLAHGTNGTTEWPLSIIQDHSRLDASWTEHRAFP